MKEQKEEEKENDVYVLTKTCLVTLPTLHTCRAPYPAPSMWSRAVTHPLLPMSLVQRKPHPPRLPQQPPVMALHARQLTVVLRSKGINDHRRGSTRISKHPAPPSSRIPSARRLFFCRAGLGHNQLVPGVIVIQARKEGYAQAGRSQASPHFTGHAISY